MANSDVFNGILCSALCLCSILMVPFQTEADHAELLKDEEESTGN
jgi:hypothetical protein